MATRMLPGHISIYAFAPEAEDFTAPGAATLTAALGNGLGWDISCAIEDDYTLGTDGYETDDSRSICDIGNVENITTFNYAAELNGFRSDPNDTTAVYETFYELFNQPGRKYYLAIRIGPDQGTAFASGQEVSFFEFDTDYPVDVTGDNEVIRLGARFKPTGNLHTFATLAA